MNDTYWDEYDDEVEGEIIPLILANVVDESSHHYEKQAVHTSILTGESYVQKLLKGHPRAFQRTFRMPRYTYRKLEEFFENNTDLEASDTISIAQKFAMFIWIVGKGASNRDVQDRFQHSGDTVSRCFHQVLKALLIVHQHYVQQPNEDTFFADQIADNAKFSPFFDDCVGALDGTHIPVFVPAGKSIPYRNRKGYLTQNVLAACDFDMKFTYVLPGWEGSAHDARVLGDAVTNKDFVVPKGRYYLADAGYTNADWLLTPY